MRRLKGAAHCFLPAILVDVCCVNIHAGTRVDFVRGGGVEAVNTTFEGHVDGEDGEKKFFGKAAYGVRVIL